MNSKSNTPAVTPLAIPPRFSQLRKLIELQSTATPQYAEFLARRFVGVDEAELQVCEDLADQIQRIAGPELDLFLADYDFICAIVRAEELYFRRNGEYRLKSFEEAIRNVYADTAYMRRYMRGLLLTQVYWSNHTAAIDYYTKSFLGRNKPGYDLLEIGPGHGLLLFRALADARAGSITGWDLSEASLSETRSAMTALGATRPYALNERNLFAGNEVESFDAIVFSEVLEHMEEPALALGRIHERLRPGGRLYVNVPVNSPAPDHIFLLRSPEDAVDFVRAAGFGIEDTAFFPATNYKIEQARKHKLTITTCIIATKPTA